MNQLPTELLDIILSEFSSERDKLVNIIRVNREWYTTGTRILYRLIPEDLSSSQCVRCLQTLCRNEKHAKNVRELYIDWTGISYPTPGLLRLLQRSLRRLENLVGLHLQLYDPPSQCRASWIFDGCRFKLKTLITSMYCDDGLAKYLQSQPQLSELALRSLESPDQLNLPQTALPNLKSFRVVYTSSPALRSIVEGRPIENLSITVGLSDDFQLLEGFEILDALNLSGSKIQRLSIMVHHETPSEALSQISERLPDLRALHLVVVDFSVLRHSHYDFSEFLSRFKHLERFTFITSAREMFDEVGLAEEWGNYCPSLRTIITPRGNLVVRRDGKWVTP